MMLEWVDFFSFHINDCVVKMSPQYINNTCKRGLLNYDIQWIIFLQAPSFSIAQTL